MVAEVGGHGTSSSHAGGHRRRACEPGDRGVRPDLPQRLGSGPADGRGGRRAGPAFIKVCAYAPYPVKVWLNGQYAEQPAMPHEAEARPVTVGSRMLETAYLCRLRRHDLVACPSLWVSVSHIDGTGEIMTS